MFPRGQLLLVESARLTLPNLSPDNAWKVCLKNFELMPSPHCEEGSQSSFNIKTEQMLCPMKDVVFVRVVLRQPSPHWLNFSVENLRFAFPSTVILS